MRKWVCIDWFWVYDCQNIQKKGVYIRLEEILEKVRKVV